MPVTWTTQQVLALSPDASSTKSGQELANPRKWVTLGKDDIAAWGECQGSGSKPYQTEIDLREPAFKCTCPSRKFPCKHSLGLFLLVAGQPKAFTQDTKPPWVSEWIASREKKQEQKAAKKEKEDEKPPDPAAQAKRAANRETKVASGIQELETWLYDLVRNGLANVQTRPYSYWDKVAARMVDAQSPGIARMLRDMAGLPSTGEGWQGRLLERASKIHLLIEAYKRIDSLPPETQSDIRSLIGWTQDQDELLKAKGVQDRWLVLAQKVEMEESLRVQRTWLCGKDTNRTALILNFAYGNQPLDTSFVPGSGFSGELVFYPGSTPIRALIKKRDNQPLPVESFPGFACIEEMLAAYAISLSKNPWLERLPVIINNVIPRRIQNESMILDYHNQCLPIQSNFNEIWQLISISGDHPLSIFGEWDGKSFLPISAFSNRFYSLVTTGGEIWTKM